MVGGELSDQDMDELEAICLGTEGGASPLTREHTVHQRLASRPVAITGLRDLVGVNALASDQSLTFSAGGLTIVMATTARENRALFAFSRTRAAPETTRHRSCGM